MTPDAIADEVDDPILGNAMSGIQARLHVEVVTQRRVTDLDEQQDVVGRRMRASIACGFGLDDGEIGLSGPHDSIGATTARAANLAVLTGKRTEV